MDCIVVGAGITGLLSAKVFHHQGKRVYLCDQREGAGGRFRRADANEPFANPGLDFIAASQDHQQALMWLQSQASVGFSFVQQEHHPLIFSGGEFKPFVGFGNIPIVAPELLTPYLQMQQFILQPEMTQVVRSLVEQSPVEFHGRSEVTQILVESGAVRGVIINGEKTILAREVYFCPSIGALLKLLPAQALAAKHQSRLAKFRAWTSVILSLEHSAGSSLELAQVGTRAMPAESSARADAGAEVVSGVGANESVRVILPANLEKSVTPVLGRISGNKSKWFCLVADEDGENSEVTGDAVKHIKRLIKRAFPQAFESKPQEKIWLLRSSHGTPSLKTPQTFSEISGLHLANHLLAPAPSELDGVFEAMKIFGAEIEVSAEGQPTP